MSEPQVIGWEPMQAEWWLTIRATLPKPWPREAVLMDLRFWKGQEVATAHRAERLRVRRPGRYVLQQQWGWSDWDARQAFKAEDEWVDPRREVPSYAPPTSLPLPSHAPPVTTKANAGNIEESSYAPPTSLPLPSHAPPRARSLLTDPPITDHRGERGEPPTRQPQQESSPEPAGASGGASGRPASPESNLGQARPVSGTSLPVPAEGDLLPLLTSQLQMGQAAAVGRLLHTAGIYTVADAAPMDEWEIGRIVGTNHKVGTIKALRAGGWLPPKERSTRPALPTDTAGPSGVKKRTLFAQIGKEDADVQPQRNQRAS